MPSIIPVRRNVLKAQRVVATTTGYTAQGVNFNGTTAFLDRGGTLTGQADGQKGIASLWFRMDGGDGVFQQFFEGPSGLGLQISRNNTNHFTIIGTNASNFTVLQVTTGATFLVGGGWHHALAAWDLSVPTSSLYIDDVLDNPSPTNSIDTIKYTQTNWDIGARAGGSLFVNGDMADLYANFTQFLDFSVTANRRLFISATGHPVNLGTDGSVPTGTSPIVFMSGAVGSWQTNKGTGGGFTLNGTLSAATSNP